MSDPIGDWPTGRDKVETSVHVHAFGMIALNASLLEEILLLLLLAYLPMERTVAVRLATQLNNRDRSDWLRALVETNEKNSRLADLMKHAILCCDICMDNRNMLVHALYTGTDAAMGKMQLTKRARNNPLQDIKLELSVESLRKIADEIGAAVHFMMDLWFCKTHGFPPSPEKPPRPDRLTIPQPEANAGGD
jgi:hypothetical protein